MFVLDLTVRIRYISLSYRDTLIYAISANSDGLEEVTELLSEVVLRPEITSQEVSQPISIELHTGRVSTGVSYGILFLDIPVV